MDNSLAKETLFTMNKQNGAVIPPNLVPGRFTHYTVDNIDINDDTLEGKNTFHAMQMAGWQEGRLLNHFLTPLNQAVNLSYTCEMP